MCNEIEGSSLSSYSTKLYQKKIKTDYFSPSGKIVW